MLHIGVSG